MSIKKISIDDVVEKLGNVKFSAIDFMFVYDHFTYKIQGVDDGKYTYQQISPRKEEPRTGRIGHNVVKSFYPHLGISGVKLTMVL